MPMDLFAADEGGAGVQSAMAILMPPNTLQFPAAEFAVGKQHQRGPKSHADCHYLSKTAAKTRARGKPCGKSPENTSSVSGRLWMSCHRSERLIPIRFKRTALLGCRSPWSESDKSFPRLQRSAPDRPRVQ